MITLLVADHRGAPVVTCDWCGDRINTAREGNCEWLSDKDSRPVESALRNSRGSDVRRTLFFTHKGCSEPWRVRNDISTKARCEELDVFLFNLEHNCPFDRKEARATSEMLSQF